MRPEFRFIVPALVIAFVFFIVAMAICAEKLDDGSGPDGPEDMGL